MLTEAQVPLNSRHTRGKRKAHASFLNEYFNCENNTKNRTQITIEKLGNADKHKNKAQLGCMGGSVGWSRRVAQLVEELGCRFSSHMGR